MTGSNIEVELQEESPIVSEMERFRSSLCKGEGDILLLTIYIPATKTNIQIFCWNKHYFNLFSRESHIKRLAYGLVHLTLLVYLKHVFSLFFQ